MGLSNISAGPPLRQNAIATGSKLASLVSPYLAPVHGAVAWNGTLRAASNLSYPYFFFGALVQFVDSASQPSLPLAALSPIVVLLLRYS